MQFIFVDNRDSNVMALRDVVYHGCTNFISLGPFLRSMEESNEINWMILNILSWKRILMI